MIKFRVYWKKMNKMCYPKTLLSLHVLAKNPENIVMHYPGLKDKYNNDICDGDILFLHDRWRGEVYYAPGEGLCRWNIEEYNGNHSALGWYPPEAIEIIGNIHENKVLRTEFEEPLK